MKRKKDEPRMSVKALYYAYGYKGKDATVLEKWIRSECGKLKDGFGAAVVTPDSNGQPCWALNWAELRKVHAKRAAQQRPGGQLSEKELKRIFDTYLKQEGLPEVEQPVPEAVPEAISAERPAPEGADAERIYSEAMPIVAALIHARPEDYTADRRAYRRVVSLALRIREEAYQLINEQR